MANNKIRRNTRQRQVILEELKNNSSHPTAADLYNAVRKRLPKISLGTIYRNLQQMVADDLIRKLDTGGLESRYDAELDWHSHIRCLRCNRLDDFSGTVAEADGRELIHEGGYKVIGYRLEFVGICPDCREKSTN